MRTTLTLDDDVAAKLKAVVRRSGRSFKDAVNEVLRLGLSAREKPKARRRFVVKARDLGARAGLDYDDVGALLERLEGPAHR